MSLFKVPDQVYDWLPAKEIDMKRPSVAVVLTAAFLVLSGGCGKPKGVESQSDILEAVFSAYADGTGADLMRLFPSEEILEKNHVDCSSEHKREVLEEISEAKKRISDEFDRYKEQFEKGDHIHNYEFEPGKGNYGYWRVEKEYKGRNQCMDQLTASDFGRWTLRRKNIDRLDVQFYRLGDRYYVESIRFK